jgi:ketosteroid isomerase-like protein
MFLLFQEHFRFKFVLQTDLKLQEMSYYDKARNIYEMMGQGKMLEAFEKYYHKDVVMIEATGDTRKGKEANLKFQKDFLGMIKEVHGSGINAVTSNEKEGTTMVESWMDVTYKDGKRAKMEEVAVQKWQGDQIIKERFYYNMPK